MVERIFGVVDRLLGALFGVVVGAVVGLVAYICVHGLSGESAESIVNALLLWVGASAALGAVAGYAFPRVCAFCWEVLAAIVSGGD